MTVCTDGDCGDSVLLLSLLQEMPGGPHSLRVKKNSVTTLRTDEAVNRFYRITKDLVESQPYIKDYNILQPGEKIDWDSGGFRAYGFHYTGISLLQCHSQHLSMIHRGMGDNMRGRDKWLHIEPSMETKGIVVVNRTNRYNNGFFQWKRVVEHYRGRILFIGLKHEYDAFCGNFGKVSWRQTSDLLEMARLIAGSALFIGNQSSANALCEGLKHNLIQESALQIPDCIFDRPNAQHVSDGACVLPGFDGQPSLKIPSAFTPSVAFNESVVPPGMWQFPSYAPSCHLNCLANQIWMDRGRMGDKRDVRLEVADYNARRLPDYFRDSNSNLIFEKFHQAIKNSKTIPLPIPTRNSILAQL